MAWVRVATGQLGNFLLGVRAVIAESYERIHRSNLVGMGVLPLQYQAGDTAQKRALMEPRHSRFTSMIICRLDKKSRLQRKSRWRSVDFTVDCRVDTPVEVDYYRQYLAHRSSENGERRLVLPSHLWRR